MDENNDEKKNRLEIEKLELEIKQLRHSRLKLIIYQSIITVLTTFSVLGIAWLFNREYISLSLDVKRLKSEKENIEIELRKDSLSKQAKAYLDSAIILKKQIEIRDLKDRIAIVSEMGVMESMLFFDFNKAIERYNSTKDPNYLYSEFVKNLKLIENIGLRYALYSSGVQIKDTLNFIWENNRKLWEKIVPSLALFGKINPKTSINEINGYIREYKMLFKQQDSMMRNYFVNDSTGKIEILEIPGKK